MSGLRAVLLDIDGVLYAGEQPIAGAVDAVSRLRGLGYGLRFITNATRRSRAAVAAQLAAMGFDVTPDEILTGALAARRLAESRGLRPRLLIHPGLQPDFDGLATDPPDAVIVGDAADGFSYAALNEAFRVLIERPEAPLIAIARNRYFRDRDGLSLDAGPFVAALEFASGRKAVLTGKPSAALFATALAELGVHAHEALMVGDDVESDVGGALDAGLQAVLVRTGKYRPGDEHRLPAGPAEVRDDLATWVAPLPPAATAGG